MSQGFFKFCGDLKFTRVGTFYGETSSGHLRFLKNQSVINRYPLLRGSLTKISHLGLNILSAIQGMSAIERFHCITKKMPAGIFLRQIKRTVHENFMFAKHKITLSRPYLNIIKQFFSKFFSYNDLNILQFQELNT